MKKPDLGGTGQVFRFSLQQLFKAKANRISLLLLLLFSLLSVPVMSLLGQGGSGSALPAPELPEEAVLEERTLFVYNTSGLSLDLEALSALYPYQFREGTGEEGALSAHIEKEGELCSLRLSGGGEGELSELAHILKSALLEANAVEKGLDPSLIRLFSGTGVEAGWGELSRLLSAEEGEQDWETAFSIQYLYSIVVLILCLMSTSYILRSMVEEKSSRLVEQLLVSVSPLSLILGKILAVMLYIFLLLLSMGLCMFLSYTLTGLFVEGVSPLSLFAPMGLSLQDLRLDGLSLVLVLVALLLGYFSFSLLGGIAGSGCSGMEDVEAAQMGVVFLVLGGYLVSTVVSAAESSSLCVLSAFIPIVSVFCAPVQYVLGNLSLGMLLLSYCIQLLFIALLAVFGARVYESLLLYKGERLKLKQLLRLSRKGGTL